MDKIKNIKAYVLQSKNHYQTPQGVGVAIEMDFSNVYPTKEQLLQSFEELLKEGKIRAVEPISKNPFTQFYVVT